MMWRLLWLANLLVLSRSDISCDEAQRNCEDDFLGCGPKLYQILYGDVCKSALGWPKGIGMFKLYKMAETCPLPCVYAITNLTATPRGKELENCQCGTEALYLTIKARLRRCVESRGNNSTAFFGCTEARQRCSNDTKCKAIQVKFLTRCSQLISGVKCSRDCKDSQGELLDSELGKALNDCECDGKEEPYCRAIRANYELLCKATRPPRKQPDVLTSPTEHTVNMGDNNSNRRNSRANSQFELPVWIFYAAIMAHVYVFSNL